MLRELRIKHFAVIDEVSLEFGSGLNILTGETGAGKTIILNALGLLLGGRASAELIRQGEEEASVEALFSPFSEKVRFRLREADFDVREELVMRRVVSRSGKNRIYINGNLCPLGLLSEVSGHLIHIYGQQEHQSLLRPESHLDLLDAYGNLESRVGVMREKFQSLHQAWQRLKEEREKIEARKRNEEWLRSQVKEISQARLDDKEEEELKARKNLLVHAERLFQGCKEGEEILYEGEDALVTRLGRYLPRLQELAQIDQSLEETVGLLSGARAQLEEATSALRRHTDRVQFDPQALEQLEDRLAEIGRLKRKYQGSVSDLLNIQARAEEELASLERGCEEIPALEQDLERLSQTAWDAADELSAMRRQAAKKLKPDVEKELKGLGMGGTVFEIRFSGGTEETDDPPFRLGGRRITEGGLDGVEIFFSPNPGETVKPLAKIASGGELSRVMLAIKSLVMTQAEIPTLLFDEVDSGIGGRVAEMVGKKLKQVASSHQVICVTHLQQIAALADTHLVVEKEVVKGRTMTTVRELSEKERVNEVARMLGGVKVTDQAIRHAAEMIKIHGSTRGEETRNSSSPRRARR